MALGTHDIQKWLNGEILRSGWLRKQYKLIALLSILTFIYILGGYRSMQQHHRLSDLKSEVKDIKFEYLTISAKRSELTRQSQIERSLKERDSEVARNKRPVVLIKD